MCLALPVRLLFVRFLQTKGVIMAFVHKLGTQAKPCDCLLCMASVQCQGFLQGVLLLLVCWRKACTDMCSAQT